MKKFLKFFVLALVVTLVGCSTNEVETQKEQLRVTYSSDFETLTFSVWPTFTVTVPDKQDFNVKGAARRDDFFDSFYSYELNEPNNFDELEHFPVVSAVSFVNKDSIQRYIDESENDNVKKDRELLLGKFDAQKKAFEEKVSYEDTDLKQLGGNSYFVNKRECAGDIYGCSLMMYTTFVGDVRVDIAVSLDENVAEEEALVSQIKIENLESRPAVIKLEE